MLVIVCVVSSQTLPRGHVFIRGVLDSQCSTWGCRHLKTACKVFMLKTFGVTILRF